MALNFLYGKTLKNKDSYIFENIKSCIGKGNKVLYIVPEQYSFLADKTILDVLSEKYSHMTEILNFQRMANIINKLYSPSVTEFIDDEIKNLILFRILSKNKLSSLKQANPDSVLIFREIISECKHHLINCEKLNEIKGLISPDNKFLYEKMTDLSIVLEKYEEITKNKYQDFEDNLTTLAKNINENSLFKDYEIFIDNFSTFSSSEYLVLNQLIKNCKNINITLMSDGFFTNETGALFNPTYITYKKLTRLCEGCNLIYNEINIDENGSDFYTDLFSNEEIDDNSQSITLTASKNNTDEVRSVVNEIKKIIKNGGSFSDISVYTGDLGVYSDIIEQEFETADVPYFMDKSVPLIENPVCRLLLTPLNMIISNFSIETVLEYVKSLVFLYDNHIEACAFEEFVTRFNISRFNISNTEKWDKNISFVKEIFKNTDKIEKIYQRFIVPAIEAFKGSLNYNSYLHYIRAIHFEEFLEDFVSKPSDRQEYITCYNTFIKAVKNIEIMLMGEAFKPSDYYKLLLQSLSVYKTGVLPNSIDRVTVSDIERSRDSIKKYVFILGLNDGITPLNAQNNSFLSDVEREYILDISGVELPTVLVKNSSFNLSLYRIFTSYNEKLFLSQSEYNSENERLMPSFIWQKLSELYEINYFENTCVNLQELSIYALKTKDPALIKSFEGKIDMAKVFEYIEAIKSEGFFEQNKKLDKKLIESKYNKKLNTSVSRLESYKRCGYSYFIQHILKISERETTSYDFKKTGTLVHNIIDKFSRQMVSDRIDWDGVGDIYIEKHLPDLVKKQALNAFKDASLFNPRTKYLIKKLTRTARTAILNIKEHFISGEFVPIGYEIEIGENGIPPLVIKLEDGSVMEIFGKIDRADKLKSSDDKLFIRIIDYKSSSKEFEFSMIKEGIQLQLLSYLKALVENGGKYLDFAGEILPGAAFYVAFDDSVTNFNKKPLDEDISAEIKKKFMLKGLILNDDSLITAIDRELTKSSYKSDICEVYTKKDGSFNISNLLFYEQFKKLLSECEITLKGIGNQIVEGYIPIKPFKFGTKTACDYCDFKSVCMFDKNVHKYNNMKKLKKDEYFDEISSNK